MAAAPDDRRAAFETEALPFLDAVYRVALRLAGDEAQADDLVQETMLKAYRSWHQYKSGTNVRAWLLTILRHTFINEYRKTKRAGPTVDISEIEGYHVFHEVQDVDPEGSFFKQIVDDEVLRAIDSLPDEFRETLVLSDVEQLTYAEIAEVTGVPVGTVKSRLFRARQALQQKLYDYALEMGYIKGVER
jgi:RNA polymerase sigma-70 factor (ECF subfamily)